MQLYHIYMLKTEIRSVKKAFKVKKAFILTKRVHMNAELHKPATPGG